MNVHPPPMPSAYDQVETLKSDSSSPQLTAEMVANALWNSCGFKDKGTTQVTAARLHNSRIIDFLSLLPDDATIGVLRKLMEGTKP